MTWPSPARVVRLANRVVALLVLGTCGYAYLRFDLLRLPEGHDAMSPTFPARGGRLVVDGWWRHGRALRRLDIVVYRMPWRGAEQPFIGRVRALPGDVLGRRNGKLAIGGEPAGVDAGELPEGRVPPGRCLVLNENLDSAIPDGRRLGLAPLERVQGRVVWILPAGEASPP